jgi:hypothetical protein
MSNYYVRRTSKYDDELAHSLGGWLKRRAQGAHKYIAKIPIGGKMRYFYTQAELAAYKAGKTVGKGVAAVKSDVSTGVSKATYAVRRTAGNANTLLTSTGQRVRALPGNAKAAAGRAGKLVTGAGKKVRSTATGLANEVANRTGLTARSQRDNAANPLERYHAQKRYDRTPLGTAEGAIRGAGRRAGELAGRARSAASSAANTVGGAVNRAANAVADATGYSARKKSNSAPSRSMRNRAQAQYNNSPMGRVENAVKSAPGRAKSAASAAGKAISGAAGRAGKTVRRATGNAVDSVAKATGYTARQRANSARSYADRRRQIAQNTQRVSDIQSEVRANRKADQARAAYNRTPTGRAESAARSAGRAIGSVPGRVSGAARSAGRAIGSVPGRVSSAAASATNTVRNRFRKKKKGTYT